KAISCIRYLIDFILMAQYRSHTVSTIAYIEKYLQKFHEHKDVFLACYARKEDLLEEEANFNFSKIHILSHYTEQIPRYGSLLQYSTEIYETYH
ncbi:hypothetical protein BDZ91DRAFT_635518, partial [Kalaharituber pfeilii]